MSSHPITEDDLHGFVDHLLDSARRSEVQTYLDAHPEIGRAYCNLQSPTRGAPRCRRADV
jgi:anti-sigma factor RsiW